MKNKIWKLCILVMIPLVIWFIPPPEGLTELSWRLSGFYLAAICGLILKPFSEAVVLLGVVGFAVSSLITPAKSWSDMQHQRFG